VYGALIRTMSTAKIASSDKLQIGDVLSNLSKLDIYNMTKQSIAAVGLDGVTTVECSLDDDELKLVTDKVDRLFADVDGQVPMLLREVKKVKKPAAKKSTTKKVVKAATPE
jgi:Zn-dependent M32 family carboxypeptidase